MVQPQKETRTRLGRKKLIILPGPKEGVTTCHARAQGKQWVLVEWHKTGVRGKSEPEPGLGFHGKGKAQQSEQFRIGWLE